MERLNTVLPNGTFGMAVSSINTNFSLIVSAINGLEYSSTKSKGIRDYGFIPSTETLPNAANGDWCMVLSEGNTFPATIWTFDGTTWSQGGTWNPEGIDLSSYAKTTEMTAAIAASLAQAIAQIGYAEVTVSGTTLSASLQNYVLPTSGGTIHLKMSAPGTGASTLNINNTGAKELWYNGAAVSDGNTWETNEIISVFYDGTRFMASNSQGGGKADSQLDENSTLPVQNKVVTQAINTISTNLQDVEPYVRGDVRVLAVGQTYDLVEAVKTADGKMRRTTKEIRSLNLTDTLAVGELKSYNSATYRVLKAVAAYSNTTAYVEGDYAVGRPAIVVVTVDVGGFVQAGEISLVIGDVTPDNIQVTAESTAASIAADIVEAVGSIDGWTITDNEDGTITIKCNTAGANTLAFSFSDVDETGVVVSAATTAGATTISVYNGSSWSAATLAGMAADTTLFTSVDATWLLNNATRQNSVQQDFFYYDIPEEYSLADIKSGYVKSVYDGNVGNNVNINTITASADYGYIILDVKPKEKYHVWITSNGNFYWPLMAVNSAGKYCAAIKTLNLSNYVYTIPDDAVKLIVTTGSHKYFRLYKEGGQIVEDIRTDRNDDNSLYKYSLVPIATAFNGYVDTTSGQIKSISTVNLAYIQVHAGEKYKVVRRGNTSSLFSASFIKKTTAPVIGDKVTVIFTPTGGSVRTDVFTMPDDGYLVVTGVYQSVYKIETKDKNVVLENNEDTIVHLTKDDIDIPIDQVGHIHQIDYGQCAIGDTIVETYNTEGWSKIVECEEGDVFVVQGITGGNSFTTFAVLDKDNKLVAKRNNTTGSFTITIPKGGKKLYIASNSVAYNNARKLTKKKSLLSKIDAAIDSVNDKVSAINHIYSLDKITEYSVAFGNWSYNSTSGVFAANIESGGVSIVIPLAESNDWDYILINDKYCFRAWILAASDDLSVTSNRRLFYNMSGTTKRLNIKDLKDSVTFVPNYIILEIFYSGGSTALQSYALGDIEISIEKASSDSAVKKKVVCFGDSLTAGNYPTYLQTLLGSNYEVVNQGIGGQGKQQILQRLGSIPVTITSAFSLPATAAETVVVNIDTSLTYYDEAKYTPCYILGRKCTFTKTGASTARISTYEDIGHSVPVAVGTQVILQASTKYRNPGWVIIWTGTNGGVGDVSTFVNQMKAAAEYMNTQNIIVINPHTEVNTALDTALLNAFTNRFFNWRVYGATSLMYEYGLTPTETDLSYMAQGLLPSTIMNSDRVHLTDQGLHILADKLYQLIVALGG